MLNRTVRKNSLTHDRTAPHRTILERYNPHRTAPLRKKNALHHTGDIEKVKTTSHRTVPFPPQKKRTEPRRVLSKIEKRNTVRYYPVKSFAEIFVYACAR